jgi:hypothetical protein
VSIWSTTLNYDNDWPKDPPSPIVYRGSHLWPDDQDRGGHFSLAEIPGYVTHHGRALDEDGEQVWPWLRVSLIGAAEDEDYDTVLLDIGQVRQLRDELIRWLDRAEEAA